MALRYLARRALQQRALVPRVQPSAGSRPASTRGSSPPQGLLINESKAAPAASKGKKEPELLGTDVSRLTNEEICQKLEEIGSKYNATIEDLKEAVRYQVFEKWCWMGSAATGVGLALVQIAFDVRKQGEMTWEAEGAEA